MLLLNILRKNVTFPTYEPKSNKFRVTSIKIKGNVIKAPVILNYNRISPQRIANICSRKTTILWGSKDILFDFLTLYNPAKQLNIIIGKSKSAWRP